jgi:hypothetical protein
MEKSGQLRAPAALVMEWRGRWVGPEPVMSSPAVDPQTSSPSLYRLSYRGPDYPSSTDDNSVANLPGRERCQVPDLGRSVRMRAEWKRLL